MRQVNAIPTLHLALSLGNAHVQRAVIDRPHAGGGVDETTKRSRAPRPRGQSSAGSHPSTAALSGRDRGRRASWPAPRGCSPSHRAGGCTSPSHIPRPGAFAPSAPRQDDRVAGRRHHSHRPRSPRRPATRSTSPARSAPSTWCAAGPLRRPASAPRQSWAPRVSSQRWLVDDVERLAVEEDAAGGVAGHRGEDDGHPAGRDTHGLMVGLAGGNRRGRGEGAARARLGSVTAKLLRHAPAKTVFLNPSHPRMRKLLPLALSSSRRPGRAPLARVWQKSAARR